MIVAQLVALVIFLLYLVRLRSVVASASQADDDAVISTADYSLHISGLDKTVPADELLERLSAEIEGLEDEHGNFEGTVRHIELGRHCRELVTVLNEMRALDVRDAAHSPDPFHHLFG